MWCKCEAALAPILMSILCCLYFWEEIKGKDIPEREMKHEAASLLPLTWWGRVLPLDSTHEGALSAKMKKG